MVCRAGLELLSRQSGHRVDYSKLFNILKLMVRQLRRCFWTIFTCFSALHNRTPDARCDTQHDALYCIAHAYWMSHWMLIGFLRSDDMAH